MILVIADDLTGAAETGGIGLNHGLRVEVQTVLQPKTDAEMLVVDTNTRSLSSRTAGREIRTMTQGIKDMPLDWIYKKTDSVLRGHVRTELQVLLKSTRKKRVLLVPANPSLGRTVVRGFYYINNVLLHQTEFSRDPEYRDPEHRARSSDVLKILGSSQSFQTFFLEKNQSFPEGGLCVGAVKGWADLFDWAGRVDEDVLPAGAAEFFAALLRIKGFSRVRSHEDTALPAGEKALVVCGSTSESARDFIETARGHGRPVCPIPRQLFESGRNAGSLVMEWSKTVLAAFGRHHKVIMTIGRPVIRDPALALRLRGHMADAVRAVLGTVPLRELFIEGGATASSILRRLQWQRFQPCRELAPGVVRMGLVGDPQKHVTLKPGSYPWPPGL